MSLTAVAALLLRGGGGQEATGGGGRAPSPRGRRMRGNCRQRPRSVPAKEEDARPLAASAALML